MTGGMPRAGWKCAIPQTFCGISNSHSISNSWLTLWKTGFFIPNVLGWAVRILTYPLNR